MKLISESYPDRIRRIAREVSQFRTLYQVDQSVEKLRLIANELEQVLRVRNRSDQSRPLN